MDVSKTITQAEAAKRANVVEGTIRLAIQRGELRTAKTACGRATLVSAASLKQWSDKRNGAKQ